MRGVRSEATKDRPAIKRAGLTGWPVFLSAHRVKGSTRGRPSPRTAPPLSRSTLSPNLYRFRHRLTRNNDRPQTEESTQGADSGPAKRSPQLGTVRVSTHAPPTVPLEPITTYFHISSYPGVLRDIRAQQQARQNTICSRRQETTIVVRILLQGRKSDIHHP